MRRSFVKESFFSLPAEALFAFHERPDAFRLLTPESFEIEVLSTASTLRPSEDVVRFVTRPLGLPQRMAMVHTRYEPPHLFVDEQLQGPFSTWRHDHQLRAGGWKGDPAVMLRDWIRISHPLLFLPLPLIRRQLRELFAYRHRITAQTLAAEMAAGPMAGLRVAVTGATGLIGRRLCELLQEQGCHVIALVREPQRAQLEEGIEQVRWDFDDPGQGDWRAALERADALVHLAGTPLFAQRWTPEFKLRMERSRVEGTRQLVQAMAAAQRRPRVFVSASAIGFYGQDAGGLCDERAPPGQDLLARICLGWEDEARAAERLGVRCVQLRIGIVLSEASGALKEMLPLFRLGLGAVLGRPEPWINWVHLEDVVRVCTMALLDEGLQGPLNVVAPHPVSNAVFARTLGQVLGRPCLLRAPVWALKFGIGEAAEYASGGPRVLADEVRGRGYRFFFDDLEGAYQSLLGRW